MLFVCSVCASGEPLVQLLLFKAVAMAKHNNPLLLPVGEHITTPADGFLTTHALLFQLLLHYWSMLDPAGAR